MPSYGTPFTLPIEPLETILQRHRDLIAQIERLIVVPDEKIQQDLVRVLVHHELSPLKLLARMVGPLPASEENHDDGTYGLYRHSLTVTIRALTKFHGRTPKPHEPKGKEAKRHYRELVTTFIAALTHDLGKILFLTVDIAGCPNPVRPWDPARGYLLDYVAHCKGTAIACSWMWGRTRTGFRGHEPLAAWYFTSITPPTLLKYLGAEQANNIIAIYARSLGPSISGIADLVKEADIEVSIEALRQRPAAPHSGGPGTTATPMPVRGLAPIISLPKLGTGSRIEDFLAMFREMVSEFAINRLNADLYVSTTHTIIPIGMPDRTRRVKGGGQGSVLRRVAERVRNKLHMDPTADPNVKQFYLIAEGNKYLGFLSEMSQGKAYWCVPSVPPVNGVPVEIRHYLTVERDRTAAAFHETPVIIIRNEILWGDIDAAAIHGIFGETILLTDPRKEAASVDPESLGFRAFEKPVMRTTSPPPHEERTITASALAYRSWLALNQLSPYSQLANPVRTHWDALAAKLAQPASMSDDNLLMNALEAIAERLDNLVAHQASPTTPIASAMVAASHASAAASRSDARSTPLPSRHIDVTPAPTTAAIPSPSTTSAPAQPSPPPAPSPARPANMASIIAARLVAAAQGDPVDPPSGDRPHPDQHIIIIRDTACLAWPAVPRALMPDLTEMELAKLLPQIAVKLNAEGGPDGAWLHRKNFSSIRYPEPRTDSSYLIFNRSLMAPFGDQESVSDSIATYYAEEVPA